MCRLISLRFVVEFGVGSEDAVGIEFLAPVALQIFCNLRLILDTLVDLEDKIVFSCSVWW